MVDEIGLATHNLGDINLQTVGGAVATGTHGSGRDLPNLATMLVGGRMITADGQIFDFSDKDEDFIRAARISLGSLGIMTKMELHLLPSYQLHRQEWCTDTDHCIEHLDELLDLNRNFDFYWYPRSDRVKLRTLNPPGREISLSYASLVEYITGPSGDVISKARTLRFDEMEYSMPAEVGPDCFREVRKAIKDNHRKCVGWRLLYRLTAPDLSYMSNAYGRRSVSISLHQNNTLPFWDYFKDIEPIFRSYGGRPHWAKKHTLGHEELRELYPEWDQFKKIREEMDPEGLFMSKGMRHLLGD